MTPAKVLLCILLAAFFDSVWADQVVPSDRVATRLRLRNDPGVTSAIVGRLNRREHAKLVAASRFGSK